MDNFFQNYSILLHFSGIGMSVANTTGRLATPTTTSNIFAAAGGGPSSMKTVGGENNIGSDANQVQNNKIL